MPEPTNEVTPAEAFDTRRWDSSTVRVWAAMDNMALIRDRVLAIVGTGRVMNKISTYVHTGGLDDLRNLDHATGLKMGGHAAYPDGHNSWESEDQAGFSVYLTHDLDRLGSMEGFGVGVLRYNAAEERKVRTRYDLGSQASLDQYHFNRRRDITYLEIHGRPGQPHRDDRIEVMGWNEHGVLRHTIITFVEPGYCDSGRVEETNYLVVGHRTAAPEKTSPIREDDPEVLHSGTDLDEARTLARTFNRQPDIDFAWVAREKVTRERKSV